MFFNFKEIFFMTFIFVTSYLIIPITILNYSSVENINKAALIIFLLTAFLAFAINIIFSYLRGKNLLIPLLSVAISLGLLVTFNNSAALLTIVITILSYLGYYLGTIFTKNK